MKLIFNDTETFIQLDSYTIYNKKPLVFIASSEHDLISDINLFSGFRLYEDDEETLARDCSDYIYQWNIHQDYENGIYLTNQENYHDEEPTPIDYEEMLNKAKTAKVAQSKTALAEYLQDTPLISSVHGGKEGVYSVTQEKQTLMMSQYMTYQIEKAINPEAKLTWNESGEECEEWTESEFLQLILEVKQYVYPLVSYQQSIEKAIQVCTTAEELNAIVIDYSNLQK